MGYGPIAALIYRSIIIFALYLRCFQMPLGRPSTLGREGSLVLDLAVIIC
jgi:hypothetical protein